MGKLTRRVEYLPDFSVRHCWVRCSSAEQVRNEVVVAQDSGFGQATSPRAEAYHCRKVSVIAPRQIERWRVWFVCISYEVPRELMSSVSFQNRTGVNGTQTAREAVSLSPIPISGGFFFLPEAVDAIISSALVTLDITSPGSQKTTAGSTTSR